MRVLSCKRHRAREGGREGGRERDKKRNCQEVRKGDWVRRRVIWL